MNVVLKVVVLLLAAVVLIAGTTLIKRFLQTAGLEQVLRDLPEVEAIDDFFVLNGEAIFTMRLSNNRSIDLFDVKHDDLNGGSFGIEGINGRKIMCKTENGWVTHFNNLEWQRAMENSVKLAAVRQVIANFDQLEKFAEGNLPTEIVEEPSGSDWNLKICDFVNRGSATL